MRNRALYIGVAIVALSSLPACTMDPADEATEASEVGLAEPVSDVKSTEGASSNEDVQQSVIADDATTNLVDCGLTTYSDRHCYIIRNCHDHPIHRRIVKYSGATTACFYIPAGGTFSDCLSSGRVWYMEGC